MRIIKYARFEVLTLVNIRIVIFCIGCDACNLAGHYIVLVRWNIMPACRCHISGDSHLYHKVCSLCVKFPNCEIFDQRSR
jgi:hypothetical protein